MQKSLKEAIEPAEPDDEDLPMPAPLIEEEESAEILDVLALHMSMKGVDSYERGDVGSETQLSSSPALQSTIKQSLLSSLMDEDLHDASLDTIQLSLVKASQNDSFQSATLGLIKQAFTAALNDEAFVGDLMQSIVGAIVQASKEEELTKSVMDVVTLAVSQALNDERFVAELRGAIKDTLQDGDIYKAGAKGMLTAAFGGGKTKDQKEEVSQAGQISARFLLGRPSAS